MSEFYRFEKGVFTFRRRHETLRIEGWGKNGLRVRATENRRFTGEDWALTEDGSHAAECWEEHRPTPDGFGQNIAVIENGDIRAEVTEHGRIRFLNKEGALLLQEHYLSMDHGCGFGGERDWINGQYRGRSFKAVGGENYRIDLSFEARPGEKIFGMGQYQQTNLDLKGCILDLRQINTQASVPFYVSNLGYGFLMNSPAIGKVSFGNNRTEWSFRSSKETDYWITAGDTPAQLLEQYTAVTGRAPKMPDYALGFWQCKLRYQTQKELLTVAREYKRRQIPIDIIVADFFHWTKMGEWKFDPQFWPDPEGMVKELEEMGIRLVVSVWPTVDMQSENMAYMADHDLLVRTDLGMPRHMDCMNIAQFADMTNPETREYVWDIINRNYLQKGISQFWLDVAEPEFANPDHEIYRYYKGPALEVGNAYPADYAKMIYEGMRASGREDVVSLVRCAWAGSQKYGALAWSGDVQSDFKTFRRQVTAGLNMGMAGIPWWNADIGGFFSGNIHDEAFHELLCRWFAFGAFSPVMRLHGDRDPHDKPILISSGGKECAPSGADNEVWSFGPEVEQILRKFIDLRYRLRPYLSKTMDQASTNGSPVIRPLFFNFPEDAAAWEIEDAYCLGDDLLVAPIFEAGLRSRTVYLPRGSAWIHASSGKRCEGGTCVTVGAPLDEIPLFCREGAEVLSLL